MDTEQSCYSLTEHKRTLSTTKLIILYFFIYATLGWIIETIFCLIDLGYFTKRGFLFGALCPIYGYGAIILLLILKPFKKNNFLLFFMSVFVFSIFEYLVSFGLEALFVTHFWDYSNEFLNLNGRISVFFSLAWGIFAILFIHFIHPFIEKKIDFILEKLPFTLQNIFLDIFMIVYFVDTLASSVKYLI